MIHINIVDGVVTAKATSTTNSKTAVEASPTTSASVDAAASVSFRLEQNVNFLSKDPA